MEKEINKMFRQQRNLLLVLGLFAIATFTLLTGFITIPKQNKTMVSGDMTWEEMYYDMKKQRDSMEVERDEFERKFEESVGYWQQCETKLNQ